MANHLEHLARRLEDDPFFLACPLRLFAKSEGLDDVGLMAALQCTNDALLAMRLCRAPHEEEPFFESIERVATRFAVDVEALAVAVRRGQAIFQLARTATAPTLLAARDGVPGASSATTAEGNS